MFKWFSVICCIFLYNLSYSQIKKIDSILENTFEEFYKFNYFESIELGNQGLIASKEAGYSKGIVISNIYLAKAFIELGDYKKGLVLLSNAQEEPAFKSNLNFQVETCRLKGRAYGSLGLNDLALNEFYKQLIYSNKIAVVDQRRLSILWTYQNLVHIYKSKENTDSINKYLSLQKESLKYLDEKKDFIEISNIYNQLAKQKIDESELVEAKKYAEKSLDLIVANNSMYLFSSYEVLGLLSEASGEFVKAEVFYEKALANSLEINNVKSVSYYYKILAEFYQNHKLNVKERNIYFLKHRKINDSLKLINNHVLDKVYSEILKEQRINDNENIKKVKRYLIISVSIGFLVVVMLYWRKKRLKFLLRNKQNEINKQREESVALIKDLQTQKYDELIFKARNNSPDFLIVFQEIFPVAIKNMKLKNPNVTASEICFCALAFLNFSTKEIAVIQNVTIRAVQVRKNRLRKKYNIPSKADFNLWMIENLGDYSVKNK